MAIFRMFKNSALELKNLHCLTVTAMLIALNLALKSVTIYITDDMKISFSFLALAAIGMLFGPTVGFMAGTVTDILGMLIAQNIGAFNPLFTLVEATGAMLYGLFLYKLTPIRLSKDGFKNVTADKNMLFSFLRVIGAKLSVAIVCNIIMNPLFMVLLGYWGWETAVMVKLPARLLKNAIQCPVDIILLLLVLFPVMVAYNSIFRQNTFHKTAEQ